MEGSYTEELKTARKAIDEASSVINEFRRGRDFNIQLKGKNDLLTEADVAAENAILDVIKGAFKDDEILAEESTGVKDLPESRVWIIDPIDGTTNFAHGFPEFGISVALWEEREAKLGMVYNIARDEIFHAVKGGGAFLNDKAIQVSGITELKNSLIATGFPYRDLGLVDPYLDLFKTLMHETHGVRRPGSASIDLCNVAAGRFDGFYEYGLSPWDVAAGALIIREAGGIVTDWIGGDHWLLGQRIIAGNKAIPGKLQHLITRHFKARDLQI
ncbi:inositol monophosphatase family protein [Balneola sp. MJW-20]|uniref:inositol monophosphatase family protein n=1 Tax=Gracilimonas aurantiaca TaxID=3234185 RepID=UPI003466B923